MLLFVHNIKKRQPVILHEENRKNWFDSGLDFQKVLDESFNFRLKNQVVISPLKYN